MKKSNHFTKAELNMFKSQNPIFNEAQMKIINRKTPASEVEIKEDKSGHKYKSIKASYVKAVLMIVTGGNYDFEIKSREFIASTKEVLVEARLTIFTEGNSVARDQFGQHHLNVKSTTNEAGNKTYYSASDIGNGYKAAASDAFKKCLSEFGFFRDIYGQEHAEKKKEEQAPTLKHGDNKKLERLSHFLKECKDVQQVEYVYEKWLYTAKETEDSKNLLQEHMNRVLKSKANDNA